MSSQKSTWTRVGAVIGDSLKALHPEKNFKVYPLWLKWKELVGPLVAANATPAFVEGKTLVVAVKNNVWMNELALQKPALLEKIASLNLDSSIEELRFIL